MSQGPNDHGIVELSVRLGELQVTIKGPVGKATKLLQDITSRGPPSSPAHSGTSETSFAVVSEVEHTTTRRTETRAEIEASFEGCPAYLIADGHRLSGGPLSGEDRVRRAWLAGKWARAFSSGRSSSPNASPQLPLRSKCYAVLRSERLQRPTIYRSARSYWACVGELATSDSISHSFPSEQEAKVYFAGAGVSDFDILQ